MQMLVLIIIALMLISCDESNQAELKVVMDEKCKSYIQFEFKSPEKYVWVCSSEKLLIPKNASIKEGSYKGMTTYEVVEFGDIIFPPSRFKKIGNDIYINEVPMKDFMNAVVTADGKVLMGHFIRTFD